jgi:hypothetical protein
MSVNSYLASRLLPTLATLEGSSVDNDIVLLSVSFGWMDILEVLTSGMIRAGGGGTRPRLALVIGDLQTPTACQQSHSSLCHNRKPD